MADNVYCSRQVLIVLSDNYLASNFCREELHMAVQRGVDAGDSSLILVMINKLKKRQLPAALRNKNLLDFDKHKKKQDWEQKILREISESKTFKADESVWESRGLNQTKSNNSYTTSKLSLCELRLIIQCSLRLFFVRESRGTPVKL